MSPAAEEPGLAQFARQLRWVRRIQAPDAPGFVFFGGELDPADFGLAGYGGPVSLSGKGTAASEAFSGCIGEGIEHLSRLEWGDEALVRGSCAAINHGLDQASLAEILKLIGFGDSRPPGELDWMPATRLSDGARLRVPAALCLRCPSRGDAPAMPSAISTGCAAGPAREAAILGALLELIERDAAALWWMGGRRGRGFGLNTLAQTGAAEMLRRLREGNCSRPTWLLNLTSDIGVPCVAALSAAADGTGFACGTAARLNRADAVRAALLELCQSELGHHLVAAKRSVRGEQALNEVDRRKLDRGGSFDACTCELLHPFGFPEDLAGAKPAENADAIGAVVECLGRIGVEPLLVDLTRSALPLPAVRVIAPGLQPFPSSLITGRLALTIANLGTRAAKPVGMPLF
jgi:ribosomal protein S12 methylthiotransferase accessory factor